MRIRFTLLLASSLVVQAANFTVDDDDSSIIYVPRDQWTATGHEHPLDAGGAHTLTSNSEATAAFTFTGMPIRFFRLT